MKANVNIEVKPFSVPEYAILIAEQGDATSATVKLSAIDDMALSAMCDDFRAKVFKAAGKVDPKLK